jgi:purine-binding chemotaxis protein CheW
MDLRLRFGMPEREYTDRTCIIVLEHEIDDRTVQMGIVVDTVSEVLPMRASEIEETPHFGASIDTKHILAIAKMESGVKILLDIDYVLTGREQVAVQNLFE